MVGVSVDGIDIVDLSFLRKEKERGFCEGMDEWVVGCLGLRDYGISGFFEGRGELFN